MPKRTTGPRSRLAALLKPPKRSDARRNYEALLAAAAEVFGREGPSASLDEIARRARVGNATLYRHFPTRRDLLVAVCVDEVETLCVLGDQLRSHAQPGDALAAWLGAYIEHVRSRQGLGAAMMTGRSDDSAVVTACQTAIEATAVALLERAQQAGAIRSDLDLSDLLKLVNGVAIATEPDSTDQADRLLRLILEGITISPGDRHRAQL